MKQYVASHLKNMNRQVVYHYIADQKVTSKAEIEKETGISAPTVIKIVDYLKKTGLVRELGESQLSAVGRRPQLISINRSAFYVVSFLLEGEFLSMGVVDNAHRVIYQKTERLQLTFEEIWNRISDCYIDMLLSESGLDRANLAGIGIGLPATLNIKTKMIGVSPLIGILEPMSLKDRLIALSMKYEVPAFIENDANAYCLGERWLRREDDIQKLTFISIGTGIGAGIIMSDSILRGNNGKAGEIGTSIVADGDELRTLEEIIGYKALMKRFDIDGFSELSQGKIDEISAYISRPLALAIYNTAVLLGCDHFFVGGILMKCLGVRAIEQINNVLSRIGTGELQVQPPKSDDGGLIGVAKDLIANRISEILMEE